MKVALIGTHCVGKTGLLGLTYSWFIRNGEDVNIVKEMSESPPVPLKINEESELVDQRAIILLQMAFEEAIGRKHDHLITDRGTIDNWMYLQRVKEEAEKRTPLSEIEQRILSDLGDLVLSWSSTYDFQFLLTPGRYRLEPNRTRSINPSFQREIHERLMGYIGDNQMPNIYSLSPTEDHFEQVKRAIREKYPGKFKED